MKGIVTVGISASGKTVWAEEFIRNRNDWVNINRDDVRFDTFCGGERNWKKYKFSRANETKVTEICNKQIEDAVKNNLNVVISDTNLSKEYRDKLISKLEGLGYEVELKDFPITLEEAWKRDSLRANGVGHTIIYQQYLKWLEYIGREKYKAPEGFSPNCVLVDVDNTVALKGDRSPFDWSKVKDDKPISVIMDIVDGFYEKGYDIIFLSGRDSVCYKDTYEWLQHYFTFPFQLYMRPEGDCRRDSIVKEELFWQHVGHKYNVRCVLDDRPQVCRMWNELGLKVIQVADPLVEF